MQYKNIRAVRTIRFHQVSAIPGSATHWLVQDQHPNQPTNQQHFSCADTRPSSSSSLGSFHIICDCCCFFHPGLRCKKTVISFSVAMFNIQNHANAEVCMLWALWCTLGQSPPVTCNKWANMWTITFMTQPVWLAVKKQVHLQPYTVNHSLLSPWRLSRLGCLISMSCYCTHTHTRTARHHTFYAMLCLQWDVRQLTQRLCSSLGDIKRLVTLVWLCVMRGDLR